MARTRTSLRETSPVARSIMDGDYDTQLDYIAQAVQARKKTLYRPGRRVKFVGTRKYDLDGQVGTIVKVNAKSITVGVGERDEFGYPNEYNVSPTLLELVDE